MTTLPTLTTERLTLRQWTAADVEPMTAINTDPEVMRWIGDGTPGSVEQTERIIGLCHEMFAERGFGLFAVEVRETGELAGFTGLSVPNFLPEILPAVEVGWRLGRRFWGRGYATEAARACLRHAFTTCALDRLVSIHQIGNDASENVMRKLGMRHDHDTRRPQNGAPLRVYALTRDAWRASADGSAA